MDCGANAADGGFKFTTASILMWLLARVDWTVWCRGVPSEVLRHDAVRFFSSEIPEGLCIRTASTHSSPVVDLHRRGVRKSSLKPRNGVVYMPFGDQEVLCMRRCRRTSLRAPRITFIRTRYTHFSVFRCFFFVVQIYCGTYATPGIWRQVSKPLYCVQLACIVYERKGIEGTLTCGLE